MAVIRLICDGGSKYGFGHLRRSATLAEAFKKAGHAVSIDALSDEAKSILPEAPADPGEPNVYVVDLPYDGDAFVLSARQKGCGVAALDFVGRVPPDLIVSIFDRGTALGGVRHLFGLEYAIIRTEITKLAAASTGRGVIVIMGGGDQEGLGEEIAQRLNSIAVPVVLVEGPLAQRTRELPAEIERLRTPPDLAQRMAACAWAVTSGGGTMLEMLCLGKPVHVVPRTPFEVRLALMIEEQGALLGVGGDTLRAPSPRQSEEVAGRARTLVDGRGADRIVCAVEALL